MLDVDGAVTDTDYCKLKSARRTSYFQQVLRSFIFCRPPVYEGTGNDSNRSVPDLDDGDPKVIWGVCLLISPIIVRRLSLSMPQKKQ